MLNPSFDELDEINESRYALCIMVAERARKLVDGSKPLYETKKKNPITIALDEVMERKVVEE